MLSNNQGIVTQKLNWQKLRHFNYVHYGIFNAYTKLTVKITLNHLYILAHIKQCNIFYGVSLFNSACNDEAVVINGM